MDATHFPIPQEKAIFYFYNPFEEKVMNMVLTNIQRSLEEHPREAFIVYSNPMLGSLPDCHEFEKVKMIKHVYIYRSTIQASEVIAPGFVNTCGVIGMELLQLISLQPQTYL